LRLAGGMTTETTEGGGSAARAPTTPEKRSTGCPVSLRGPF